MYLRRTLMTLALTSVLSTTAAAADLVTPTLFAGGPSGQNVCVVTNVGPTPITVTVKMITLLSGTPEETCTLQPNDPSGCQEFANDLAYCRVSVQGSSKKVRAVMMNRQTSSPFTIHAAVEAR